MLKLSLFATLFLTTASLAADGCCGGPNKANPLNNATQNCLQRDFPLVKQDIDSKRSIPIEEKSKNLSFSGDIRAIWSHTAEKVPCFHKVDEAGERVIDKTTQTSFAKDAYGVEFNLYVDYTQGGAWGVAWVQFANAAGLVGALRECNELNKQACRGSGTCENVCLRKAYIGCNIISDGCMRVDVEVGRRPLWTIFDSRVQFNQNFDGVLLSSAYNLCGYSDLYLNAGGFVIDERSHHYGYVAETGYLNILDYGVDLKYSIISWAKSGLNRCRVPHAFGNQFLVSQFTASYDLDYGFLWNNTKLYGAFLINSKSPKSLKYFEEFHKKGNIGWYAGVLMGEICKQGDWALDINYQYVETLAIPRADASGIGSGNIFAENFPFTPFETRGVTNYRGFRFEALYALSDNFVIDVLLQFSSRIDREVRGKHSFSQFQLEAIYAF